MQRSRRGGGRSGGRRAAAALALLLTAPAACAERAPGVFAPVEGFAGVVTGDEPRAVVVGREVLGNGGTAVDAAVATYFTMAVTLPSRVGLGGGGVCVLFRSQEKRGEAIEFLPRPAPSGGIVPSGVRAMAALHARHGSLRWEQLLAPAESLARFGHAVSRAFEKDLAAAAAVIDRSPDLKRAFSARQGHLARAGDRIVQDELSAVLSGVRQQGAAYLHSGPFTHRLAEASTAVGLPLSSDDVRGAIPRVVDAVAVPAGKHVAYFAPPRATGGVVAAQLWHALTEVESYRDAGRDLRPHLIAEASLRALADRARWMERDGTSREPVPDLVSEGHVARLMADFDAGRHTPARRFAPPPPEVSSQAYSAGFVIGDQWSNAIACNFTMNRLFGAWRMAEGTGILLAAPPRSENDGSTSLTAVVVGNANTGDVRFAGIAGEGTTAATALVQVMLESVAGGRDLAAAMATARVHHGGSPDVLWHEPAVNGAVREGLAQRGHELREVPALGHANALYCPDGLKDHPETCEVANDPRGFGLAYVAQ